MGKVWGAGQGGWGETGAAAPAVRIINSRRRQWPGAGHLTAQISPPCVIFKFPPCGELPELPLKYRHLPAGPTLPRLPFLCWYFRLTAPRLSANAADVIDHTESLTDGSSTLLIPHVS
jgi:hypothetical protein